MENYVVTIIIQSVIFALGLFKMWTDLQIKIKEIDVTMFNLRTRVDDLYEVYTRLDKFSDKLNSIEVKLERKQNKE